MRETHRQYIKLAILILSIAAAINAQQEWYIPKRTEVLKAGSGELGFRLQTLSNSDGSLNSRVTEFIPSVRYSPFDWLEAYGEIPEVYAEQEVQIGNEPVGKNRTDIGDAFVQLSFDVFSGEDWRVIPSFDIVFPTGTDPFDNEVGTGGGVYRFACGITGMKVVDPAVLFAFVGYQRSMADTFEIGRVEPGDVYRYRFGLSFALNPQIRLGFNISGDIVTSSKLDFETTAGSSADIMRFGMRLDWSVSAGTKLALDTVFGVIDDAPDAVISLGVSFQFGRK